MQIVWGKAKERIVMSSIGMILFLSSLYYWDTLPLLPLLIGAVITLSVAEYYKLAEAKGLSPLYVIGLVGTSSYLMALFARAFVPSLSPLPWIILGGVLAISFASFFVAGTAPLVNLATTLFPLAYLAIPLGFSIPLTYEFGPVWLFYLVLITKATDTGALLTGKLFGKRLLAQYISPKKTWEGAIGGFLTAIIASLIFFYFANIHISLVTSLVWTSLLSIFAQFGDLAESLLKRDSGIKDSAKLPGLGGFLDIVDSLVFTTPLLYLFLRMS